MEATIHVHSSGNSTSPGGEPASPKWSRAPQLGKNLEAALSPLKLGVKAGAGSQVDHAFHNVPGTHWVLSLKQR
jgi:hypothetical protein